MIVDLGSGPGGYPREGRQPRSGGPGHISSKNRKDLKPLKQVAIQRRQQLGMPMGTARNKLIRMLMFDFIQKNGLNSCFVCGEEMCVDTFSIEHIEPWLHNSPDLFWDLDNISYSHKRCNTPNRQYRTSHCPKGHEKSVYVSKRGRKTTCHECKKEWSKRVDYPARRRELRAAKKKQ